MPRYRPRVLRAALLVTLLALIVACAPAAVTPPPGTTAEPTTSARPRDVDISGILPCELLTDAQRAELRLDGEPRLSSGNDALFGQARSCNVRRFETRPAITLRITLAVEYGIERFTDPRLVTPAEPVEIAGYPAVLSPPPPSMPDNCLVAVDVAPGQMVGVMLSDGGGDPPVPLDQLCRDVPRYAEAVMTTLLAR
jgi:hypothetical protein